MPLGLRSGTNIKTIRGGCKVFFHGDQFFLAFVEKKSILRITKMVPQGPGRSPCRHGRGWPKGARGKNEPFPFLFLTKAAIFAKSQSSAVVSVPPEVEAGLG
jgi:hypothetical protein